jgi:2-amino-4-hydroxy-6-hydroxymethyldihydropteridine diphosphokinase
VNSSQLTGYVGLGSNLGDREGHLRTALAALDRAGVHVRAASSIWETEPADGATGPWFLNMVVRIETTLAPPALLDALQAIERAAGRERAERNAPRTLDLDLLLVEGLAWRDARLVLPHPRMWLRRFVVAPLAEIAPELCEPATGRAARDVLAALGDAGRVRRLDPPV